MNRTSRSLSFRTLTRARLTRRLPRPTRLTVLTLEDRVVPAPLIAIGTGPGSSAQVKVYDHTQAVEFTLSPYLPAFHGGVRVAVGDVTGDGTPDVVTAQGPGGNNTVRVFDGDTGKALKGTLGSFPAFTNAQADGVWVAAGDVNGDGRDDLVLGSDGGGVPLVKVVSGKNGSLIRTVDVSKLGLTGGVRVAAGDLNSDGKADVLVSGGPGSVTRIGAFDGGNGKPLYEYLTAGAGGPRGRSHRGRGHGRGRFRRRVRRAK
jgi:FG-GAP-like repeat